MIAFWNFIVLGFFSDEIDFDELFASGERLNIVEGTIYHYWGDTYPRSDALMINTAFLDFFNQLKFPFMVATIPGQILFWLIYKYLNIAALIIDTLLAEIIEIRRIEQLMEDSDLDIHLDDTIKI